MKNNSQCLKCMFFQSKRSKDCVRLHHGYCLSPTMKKEEQKTPTCEHFLPKDLK